MRVLPHLRALPGLVIALGVLCAHARDGTVRTTAGLSLRGAVEVGAKGISVTPSGGATSVVPIADLLELLIDDVAAMAASTNLSGTTNAPTPALGTNGVVGWESKAIGPGAGGTYTPVAAGGWSVSGSGSGLKGNSDSFLLVGRRMEVSGQVFGAMTSFATTNNEAMAGLMLRDNLGESAAYAFVGVRVGSGLCFQYRQIAGGMTMRVTNTVASFPMWLRMSRMGGSVVAEVSGDGINWRPFGQANVNLGQAVRAGLAVASGVDDVPAMAGFREPTVGTAGLRYAASEGYPRVLLRGGSVLVGPIESADESVVRLGGSLEGSMVAVLNVARIEFLPPNAEMAGRLESDRPGVVLTDGDFLEGSLRRIATNTVTVSSLLLGFRSFSAGNEVATLQVGGIEAEEGAFRLRTRNGSDLRARVLEPGDGTLRAESPLLGALTVRVSEITSVRRTR